MGTLYKKIIFLIFIFLSLYVYPNNDINIPKAKDGIIDLTEWDFDRNGIVKLNGDWEFYWLELLKPEDFKDTSLELEKEYIKVPSSWAKHTRNTTKLTYEGYATYRLKIRVKNNKSYYCLKIHDIFTNYKLWINGEYMNEIGKVGTDKESSIPQFVSREYPVKLETPDNQPYKEIEIIIQASNYHHQKAGISFPVYFGTNDIVLADTKNAFVLNLLIIGIILIIGINHLFHFILRRSDKSNLYFGVLCIVMILRNITTNDHILTFWFPGMSWELLVSLDNFSGFGTIPFFALFLYTLFKKDFPKIMLYIIVAAGGVIAIIILSTPVLIFNKYQLIYNFYVLMGGLYLTFGVLLVATFRKRYGALLTFIGFFVLYATAINDVLSNMRLVNTPYVAPYGLVFYMILQSFLIARNSSRALKENEKLTMEVHNEKDNLENRIKERTEELHLRNRELIKTRRKETRNNWSNEGLALISDVLSKKRNNIEDLSKTIISVLLKHLNAQMGVLYLVNDTQDVPSLDLIATYGCDKNLIEKSHFMLGEGLIGSSFVNGKTIYITDVPENYIKLGSGLGEAKPTSVLIVPLKYEEEVVGIMEFASFNKFKDYEIAFLEKIAENIASTITILKINIESVKLQKQFKAQEKLIKEKELELQKNIEEIQFLKEEIERLKN